MDPEQATAAFRVTALPMTRIVLVDNHTLVRAGLRALIKELPGMSVVAEAADGASGLAAVRLHRPDVLVTDLSMEGMTGIELTERATRELPSLRVIILSMFSSREHVMRAISAGASAYLLKDSTQTDLAGALESIRRGGRYFAPVAARHMSELTAESPDEDPLALLTSRQREILRMIAEGIPAKQIAHRLGISTKTVDAHRTAIKERLRVRELAELVKVACRTGLVSLEC
jgi:DNA-binding NarL/FixJ family response regulator